jgi:hypothetical protein
VTAIISEAVGRPLSYQGISDEEARERYSRISGSQEETEAHVALWQAIHEGRLAATTDRVERILGRKPITLRQWHRRTSARFSTNFDWTAGRPVQHERRAGELPGSYAPKQAFNDAGQVSFELIAIDLPQTRFRIVTE